MWNSFWQKAALLLCALGLCAAQAQAAPCRVGTVVRVVGQVEVQRATQHFAPFEGLGLCQGDRFLTQADSIAEFRLRDGSLITVGKNSEFVIREFHLYNSGKPNVGLFELVKGAFRGVTGVISRRSHRFEIKTSVATIGIRGTTFWGGFGLTEGALDVVMLDGHGVYVRNEAGQVELAEAGLGTTITAGAVPTAPKAWPQEKVLRAQATISAQ